jgi:hypothetical protein
LLLNVGVCASPTCIRCHFESGTCEAAIKSGAPPIFDCKPCGTSEHVGPSGGKPITKRGQRAFKITGLTWIVERSFAWLGRNRRLSKDYEYLVQTAETFIDIAATRLTLNRIAP